MNKETLYVTNSDGTIVDIIETTDAYVKLGEGDRVLRKGALEYLNDTVDIKYRFVKKNKIDDLLVCTLALLPDSFKNTMKKGLD